MQIKAVLLAVLIGFVVNVTAQFVYTNAYTGNEIASLGPILSSKLSAYEGAQVTQPAHISAAHALSTAHINPSELTKVVTKPNDVSWYTALPTPAQPYYSSLQKANQGIIDSVIHEAYGAHGSEVASVITSIKSVASGQVSSVASEHSKLSSQVSSLVGSVKSSATATSANMAGPTGVKVVGAFAAAGLVAVGLL